MEQARFGEEITRFSDVVLMYLVAAFGAFILLL